MNTVSKYREYALQCLQRGQATDDPEFKAVLLSLAQAWVTLSDLAAKQARSHPEKAT